MESRKGRQREAVIEKTKKLDKHNSLFLKEKRALGKRQRAL